MPVDFELPPRLVAAPDLGLYITKDDILRVVIYTTIATTNLVIVLRYIDRDGGSHYHTESLDGVPINTLSTRIIPLTEGFLISAVVSNTGGGLPDGACWVSVGLQLSRQTGTPPHQMLSQGYVSDFQSVMYPTVWSRSIVPRSYSQPVAAVAAGTEISYTVPARTMWTPLLLRGTLVTSATVATRKVSLRMTDGVNVLWQDYVTPTQAASLSYVYNFSTGANFEAAVSGATNNLAWGLPPGVPLQPGWVVGTLTDALQATYQWTSVALVVTEQTY